MALLKQILSVPIRISDLESIDKEMAESFDWMRENDGADALFLDFSVAKEGGKAGEFVDLVPHGSTVEVNDENKGNYMMLYMKYRMYDSIKDQLQAFLGGIYDVISLPQLSMFNYKELELIMCGLPEISVTDWKSQTVYRGCYNKNHQI